MSKSLKALNNIRREATIPYFSSLYDIDDWNEDFLTIEKELKALEIIKNKRVDTWCLRHIIQSNSNLDRYNNNLLEKYNNNFKVGYKLTQEEFNLLKEVLEVVDNE